NKRRRTVTAFNRKQPAQRPARTRHASSYAPARSRPDMQRRTIIILATVVAVLGLGAMAATGRLSGGKKEGPKAVAVVRGSLVDKASPSAPSSPGSRSASSPSSPVWFGGASPQS